MVNCLSYGYFCVCQKAPMSQKSIPEGTINNDPASQVCGLLYQFLPVLTSAVTYPWI